MSSISFRDMLAAFGTSIASLSGRRQHVPQGQPRQRQASRPHRIPPPAGQTRAAFKAATHRPSW